MIIKCVYMYLVGSIPLIPLSMHWLRSSVRLSVYVAHQRCCHLTLPSIHLHTTTQQLTLLSRMPQQFGSRNGEVSLKTCVSCLQYIYGTISTFEKDSAFITYSTCGFFWSVSNLQQLIWFSQHFQSCAQLVLRDKSRLLAWHALYFIHTTYSALSIKKTWTFAQDI